VRQEWLEDLLAVLDAGSITAAAERRFLTQSAFTRRVRLIERTLGSELFDRTRKPVRALPHVIEQRAEMRALLVRLKTLGNALNDPAGQSARRVSIACQHTIAATISPALIRELTKAGEVSVRVRESDRADCLMMLLTGEVDFGLIFEMPDETLGKGEKVFLEESIGRDRMIPVIGRDHEPAFESAMASRVLPMIAYPSDVYFGQLFETRFLADVVSGFTIDRTAETGLALAALRYALEGIGIAWLPRSVAAAELEEGRLRDVSDRLPSQELEVKIVRLQRGMSPLAERAWKRIANEYRAEGGRRSVDPRGRCSLTPDRARGSFS